MKVYRIEHRSEKYGSFYRGPYGASGTNSETWQTVNHDTTRPIPSKDINMEYTLRWKGKFICGFENITKLKRWFTQKERNNLHKLGFIVAEYSYNEIMKGEKQVLFTPKGKRKIIDIDN